MEKVIIDQVIVLARLNFSMHLLIIIILIFAVVGDFIFLELLDRLELEPLHIEVFASFLDGCLDNAVPGVPVDLTVGREPLALLKFAD